jgi:hypothetical protein
MLVGNRKPDPQTGWGLACQVASQAVEAAIAGAALPVASAKVSTAEAESDFVDFVI